MSHVTRISVEVKDLDTLEAACKRIGCELIRDKRTYAWYGRSVGNTALPEGFTEADLGKCDHAIRVPGAPYEVGVVSRRDGRHGYTLLWDSWVNGGLERELGADAGRLVQAYGAEATTRAARRQGYVVTETQQADGSVLLHVRGGTP